MLNLSCVDKAFISEFTRRLSVSRLALDTVAGLLEAKNKVIASRTSFSPLSDQQVQELLPANVPPSFQTLPGKLKNMQGGENAVLIPTIHSALAEAFGKELQDVNGYQGFTINSATVVDTKANPVFGALKPNITIHDARLVIVVMLSYGKGLPSLHLHGTTRWVTLKWCALQQVCKRSPEPCITTQCRARFC